VLCEPLPVWFQRPARRLVFDRTVILLETRVALLARFLLAAVFVEAGDGLPGPVCGGLAGHRIEPGGKGEVFRQVSAERLQVVLTDPTPIYPEPQRLVPDKLRGTNGFIDRMLLVLVRAQLVVQNQHADPVCEHLSCW
jgi:hypothetical protein